MSERGNNDKPRLNCNCSAVAGTEFMFTFASCWLSLISACPPVIVSDAAAIDHDNTFDRIASVVSQSKGVRGKHTAE
jgi:hypothetical protein